MNEELDSQLSAMFDNELPAAECELLARRLSRDGDLKARWGRYAVIGAVIRAERGVTLDGTSGRARERGPVERARADRPMRRDRAAGVQYRWWQPLAGAGLAAGVAAVSIFWLRSQALPGHSHVTVATGRRQLQLGGARRAAGPAERERQSTDSFVVPPAQPAAHDGRPATELADYVVAHSAFSWPVSRGNLLSALMVSEPGTSSTPARSDQPAPGVRGNAIQIQNPK